MKRHSTVVLILFTALVFVQCSKTSKWNQELADIATYLEENNITVQPTYSGLYYVETLKGSGPIAKGGDEVSVKYQGVFLDGSEFDSGTHDFTLGMGRVIKGWDEGIKYMHEGGKATLIIPSNLAYGPDDVRGIPGYSTLVFYVELLDIR